MIEADRTESSGSADAAVQAPGRRLAEARQAQSLGAADVARQLKLSVSQIEALEAGDYQRLPGPIFVRGFVRNYARLVRLDPDELVRAAADCLPQTVSRPESPPSQEIPFPGQGTRRWPIVATLAAIVVGGLAAYEFFWNEPQPADTPTAAAASSTAGARPARKSEPRATTSAPLRQPAESDTKVAQPAIAADAEPASQDAPSTAVAGAEPDRLPRPGERQVRLVFDEESWVEIRDRNERIIFSQLNRPGTQQLVSGLPPFSIVVGNAHGVRLTYEDQAIDLGRHTKVDVARLILQ